MRAPRLPSLLRDYATLTIPNAVAIGDLDGDRKPELVSANSRANSVSVFANATGHCAFRAELHT
jgi:hypothetical protein